jgi:glucose/arabinose dehydrogenase
MIMSLLFILLLAGACSESPTDNREDGGGTLDSLTLRLQTVASGFASPVYLTSPPGDARLFVVEQPGRIRIIRNGQVLSRPFLDITARVGSGGERGLLGLAFHPDYASNGFFFVNFTDRNGDTRVERFRVSANPDSADAATARLIIGQAQPFANHNGGEIMFGPDGRLYIGLGDGGSGGDPQNNGQNRNTLLGKILRIDVNGAEPYVIPPDNPFAGQASARGEIWAWGLRNPWRFAFDRVAGMMYIADVGQNAYEEINVAPAAQGGLNYGWRIMEARHCYDAGSCNMGGLTQPVLEYGHGDGCSVTGGFVYRGTRMPDVVGHYFYSDYCSGWVRSFRWANGNVTQQRDWALDAGSVLSFGEDAGGELYLLTAAGTVLHLTSN